MANILHLLTDAFLSTVDKLIGLGGLARSLSEFLPRSFSLRSEIHSMFFFTEKGWPPRWVSAEKGLPLRWVHTEK